MMFYAITLPHGAHEIDDLAKDKPALTEKAKEIFKDAHQIDPEWPLAGPTAKRKDEAKEEWVIKRKRDKGGWIPPNAKPFE